MPRYRHSPLPLRIEGQALLRELDLRFRRISTTRADTDDIVNLPGFLDFYNGTFKESFDCLATSDGATVTASLEQAGGGDLTMRWSTGLETLDCTPAATVALTPGSDSSPTFNYVYIPRSTKVITVSTTFWPSEEHIKVAGMLCPSASFVQTYGLYINQNFNDHAMGTDGQGHMTHMAQRIRASGALYFSGVDPNGATSYLTCAAGNTEFKATAGLIAQMHLHTSPAVDTSTGSVVLVKNWSGDPYHAITDLFDITADSTGTTITNNRYFNLVVWGAANKSGEFEPTLINLPSGFYTTLEGAERDTSGYDDFSIPRDFTPESSTGYLICRLTIKMGTTWVWQSTTDLRGQTPQTAAGGGGGAVATSFPDNTFEIYNVSDATKLVDFDVSGVTTGNTRTLTIPDQSGTIALTSDTPSLSLSDLTDTTITSIGAGELLEWSGSAWINQTLAELNIGDITGTVEVTGAWAFTNATLKIGGSVASPDIEITDLGTRDPEIEAPGGSLYLKALGSTTPTGDGVYLDDGGTNKAKVAAVKNITATATAPTGDYPYGTLHLIY